LTLPHDSVAGTLAAGLLLTVILVVAVRLLVGA
jgi:hypothetical protein